ncbi:DUF6215 domain-containing protein [Streptomyces sp. NPDC013187]|uniref:DUF6215 domain-containing protein n=1 Tax=Streptomyces sp. NPDC013187 TaxID=3364865 RepID=UPI0036A5B10F
MKSANAWGQALAAVVLVGALGTGFRGLAKTSSAEREPKPATCSDGSTPAAKGRHGLRRAVVRCAEPVCPAFRPGP